MKREANARPVSTRKKNTEAIATMMKTITEVIQVSLRLGHTILRPSARTWLKNCIGETFGLAGAGASTVTVWAPAAAGAQTVTVDAPAPAKPKVSPMQFFSQVRAEGRKIVWPSRKETWITSVMVFIMVAIASVFFFLVDTGLAFASRFILAIGQ